MCALKAAIYLSLLGKNGLKKLALLNLENASETHARLLQIPGVRAFSKKSFFNEFVLWIDKDPDKLKESLSRHKILGPLSLDRFYPELRRAYLFAVTENRVASDLARLEQAISETK